MMLTCALLLTVNFSGLNLVEKHEVQGQMVREDGAYYVVDFTEQLSQRDNLVTDIRIFKAKYVLKNNCHR